MRIAVAWDDDTHRIICNIFDREWTWDDFQIAKTFSFHMLTETDGAAVIVFVMPSDVQIPPNFVSHMTLLIRQIREHGSSLALVGGNPYLRSLINVLESVTGRAGSTLNSFETLDQAREWVTNRDKTLPESVETREEA